MTFSEAFNRFVEGQDVCSCNVIVNALDNGHQSVNRLERVHESEKLLESILVSKIITGLDMW